MNAAAPDVPNCTKVVRLIVVPPGISDEEVNAYAKAQNASRSDVFCVRNNTAQPNSAVQQNGASLWEPKSWLNGALVDHHQATPQTAAALSQHTDEKSPHPGTVVVLSVPDREQIQWECDVDFRVSEIKRHDENSAFPTKGGGRPAPFEISPVDKWGGLGRPIRSGPPTMKGEPYSQLYKVSFTLRIPWEEKEVIIDPDFYCDWP